MIIESRTNDKIKQACALADNSKARKVSGEFLLEGMRLCCDAALTEIKISRLFYTYEASLNDRFSTVFSAAAEKYEISSEVAQRLAKTQNTQGIFCVCAMPETGLSINTIISGGCFVALENIQDPANLGTVCRTAEALGIRGAVLSGCCDQYNPKAQRAAMGSLLRLPVMTVESLPSFLNEVRFKGTKTFAAVPRTQALDIRNVDFSGSAIVVIGNEANGVTAESESNCDALTIPMGGRAESLNASAAAAIVMWEMMRNMK